MPGGKVHTALTMATISGVLAPYAVVNLNGNEWIYVAGCVTGILIGPDMDVDQGNISDYMIRKVSRPAQWLWRIFWTPYALLIPHRHRLSHLPILGTVVRIGYVFLIVNLLSLFGQLLYGVFTFDTVSLKWVWDWSFVAGLIHVDTIHYLADKSIKGKETMENQ